MESSGQVEFDFKFFAGTQSKSIALEVVIVKNFTRKTFGKSRF